MPLVNVCSHFGAFFRMSKEGQHILSEVMLQIIVCLFIFDPIKTEPSGFCLHKNVSIMSSFETGILRTAPFSGFAQGFGVHCLAVVVWLVRLRHCLKALGLTVVNFSLFGSVFFVLAVSGRSVDLIPWLDPRSFRNIILPLSVKEGMLKRLSSSHPLFWIELKKRFDESQAFLTYFPKVLLVKSVQALNLWKTHP